MQNIANYSSSEESVQWEESPRQQVEEKRIRKVPHAIGNWATFVYIDVYSPEIDFVCSSYLKLSNLIKLDSLHISLSRTVFLKVFQIDGFVKALAAVFEKTHAFNIALKKVTAYSDDENLQHFLALDVSQGVENLKTLVEKIDTVMRSFNYDNYYADPKFHSSFGYSRTKIRTSKIRE